MRQWHLVQVVPGLLVPGFPFPIESHPAGVRLWIASRASVRSTRPECLSPGAAVVGNVPTLALRTSAEYASRSDVFSLPSAEF